MFIYYYYYYFFFLNINVVLNCPATGMQNGDEASSSIILAYSFSENGHNSYITWYIFFKFCIMYLNIVQPLV